MVEVEAAASLAKNEQQGKAFLCTHDGCNKSFSTLTHLKRHKLSHQEKAFVCSQCQKRFTTKPHLRRHELLHLAPRPFKCYHPECADVAFAKRYQLREHLCAVHGAAKEYPYQCLYCIKAFPYPGPFRLHQMSHHTEFICAICFSSFPSQIALNEHVKSHSTMTTTTIAKDAQKVLAEAPQIEQRATSEKPTESSKSKVPQCVQTSNEKITCEDTFDFTQLFPSASAPLPSPELTEQNDVLPHSQQQEQRLDDVICPHCGLKLRKRSLKNHLHTHELRFCVWQVLFLV